MNTYLAKNLLMKSFDEIVISANECVREADKRAEYMFLKKSYTLVLYPALIKQKDIKVGLEYSYFEVNGKLYCSIYYSPIKVLETIFKEKNNIQLSLF